MLLKLLDRCIPSPILRDGPRSATEARIVVLASLCGIVGSIALPIIARNYFHPFNVACALAMLLCWSMVVPVLWITRSCSIAAQLIPAGLAITLAVAITFGPGIHEYSLVVVGAIPLCAGLACGKNTAIVWSVVFSTFLFVTGFYRAHQGELYMANLMVYTGALLLAYLVYTLFFVVQKEASYHNLRKMHEEQLRLRTKLSQAEILDSLGKFAGGMAHDFNNMISVILNNAEVARIKVERFQHVHDELNSIVTASHRATELVEQLRRFMGERTYHVEPVDLTHLVKEIAEIYKASCRCQFQGAQTPEEVVVLGAPVQLQRVAFNLIQNAWQSYDPADLDGAVEVGTGTAWREDVLSSDYVPAGGLVHDRYGFFRCSDRGMGIPSELRSRVAEPFFTTKEGGTGLGLAAAVGIVRGLDGAIRIEETVGGGTTVTAYFPMADSRTSAHVRCDVVSEEPSVESASSA